jgi:hypothetical protein
MSEKSPLIQAISLHNFLSFGPESQEIILGTLNCSKKQTPGNFKKCYRILKIFRMKKLKIF